MIYKFVEIDDKRRKLLDPAAKGTLIVLTGDRGMNEAGNHGDLTLEEANAVAW